MESTAEHPALTAATRTAAEALRPPLALSVAEWADRYRVVNVGPRQGRWDGTVAPYGRAPMDAMSPSDPCTKVVVKVASQTGKTEWLNNTVFRAIHIDPDGLMMARPTDQDIKDFVKDRFKPDVRSMPFLRIRTDRSVSNENTLKSWRFPGGFLRIVTASSGAELRSTPAKIVILDEIDAMVSIPGEGHPVEIVSQRTAGYRGRKKLIYVSTPTIKGKSKISALYEESDKRKPWVPCPHCGELQVLNWHQAEWERPDNATDITEVIYVCEHNGCVITEQDKYRMIPGVQWIPEHPERSHVCKGFAKLSAMYCLEIGPTWVELAQEFVGASRDADPVRRRERLQAFWNLKMGEEWESEDGESQADAGELSGRREHFWVDMQQVSSDPALMGVPERSPAEMGARLPEGCVLLTAGADVQKDYVQIQIDGWGAGLERWVVDHRLIYGQTDMLDSAVWQDVDRWLTTAYPHASGAELFVQASCIDSRYNGHVVMPFCAARWTRRVWPIKGDDSTGESAARRPIWPGKISRPKSREGASSGYTLGVHQGKSHVYSRLRGVTAPGPFYSHFPHVFWRGGKCDREYFAQLTAEVLRTRYTGRKHVEYYHCTKGRRNEVLDITVYAYAALLGYCSVRGLSVDAAIEEARRALSDVRLQSAAPGAGTRPPPRVSSWLHGQRATGRRWVDG